MVQQAKEKVKVHPANRAPRPRIWEDSMAEVKETFRRVALVKHAGFSVWDDPRRGPTLGKVLRWNRQARNLSQVPKPLRDKVPPHVLKEIRNNRALSGFTCQTHLQNVKGMCQRIQAQKSQSERRKNLFDPTIYPVFVRRPPTVASCVVDSSELDTSPRNHRVRRPHSSPVMDYSAPLSYTPQPFKILYDISNGNFLGPSKRPRSRGSGVSSSTSCYGRLFTRPSSALSRKSGSDIGEVQPRVSSAPGRQRKRMGMPSAPSPSSVSVSSLSSTPKSRRGSQDDHSSRSNYESESRPPSRCANRPNPSKSSWRVSVLQPLVMEDLSNRSTYSECVSLDSLGMPVLFSSVTSPKAGGGSSSSSPDRPKVPRLRLRGGGCANSPRKPGSASSELTIVEQIEQASRRQEHESEYDLMFSEEEEMVRMEQRPSTVNVPLINTMVSSSEGGSFTDYNNWRPQSASNAVGRRCSRVTFASPVESNHWEGRARFGISSGADASEVNEEITAQDPDLMQQEESGEEQGKGVEEEEAEEEAVEVKEEAAMEEDEVIIKHSSDPYVDFKKSMMSMIESEGLHKESQELEQMFQYYVDLNPKMHHPILARVFQDIKAELKS